MLRVEPVPQNRKISILFSDLFSEQICRTVSFIWACMRKPTIRDVAKRAGVGVATVSRVLNNNRRVSDQTRQKVLDAIKELNFSPSILARNLSVGRTFTIGVVTPFFTYPSFVERIAGIQDALDETDYTLVLYSIRSVEQLQWQLNLLVNQQHVDGLLVLALPFSAQELRQHNPNFPLVAIDNDANQRYPHFIVDDIKGGILATDYLIAHGHRQIGFIGDQIHKPVSFTSSARRLEGLQRALDGAGLDYNPDWVWCGHHSRQAAREATRKILSAPERPTAIFASIDTLAFGVLAAAQDLGLKVPDDLAVIGFDDIPSAEIVDLTTVSQHLANSGRMGAELMLEWLERGELPPDKWRTELPLTIIERGTV